MGKVPNFTWRQTKEQIFFTLKLPSSEIKTKDIKFKQKSNHINIQLKNSQNEMETLFDVKNYINSTKGRFIFPSSRRI
jgi:hypothetical protein